MSATSTVISVTCSTTARLAIGSIANPSASGVSPMSIPMTTSTKGGDRAADRNRRGRTTATRRHRPAMR